MLAMTQEVRNSVGAQTNPMPSDSATSPEPTACATDQGGVAVTESTIIRVVDGVVLSGECRPAGGFGVGDEFPGTGRRDDHLVGPEAGRGGRGVRQCTPV